MRLTPELQARLPERQQPCVGLGRVTAGRRELFKQQQGLAVEMVQRMFDIFPCNGKAVWITRRTQASFCRFHVLNRCEPGTATHVGKAQSAHML